MPVHADVVLDCCPCRVLQPTWELPASRRRQQQQQQVEEQEVLALEAGLGGQQVQENMQQRLMTPSQPTHLT
jgi:hypothetical protein